MKTERWRKVVGGQLPDVHDWQYIGRLCYRAPVDWVLRGLLGEGSAHAKHTYVWAVRMPLFVPSTVVDLSYSHRIAGSPFDDTDVEGMSEAIKACVELCERDDAIQELAALKSSKNRAVMEACAYANILLGRPRKARNLLKTVSSQPWELDWQGEMVSRATSMLAHLTKRNSDAAVDTLHQYRSVTCNALGIRL